MQLLHQTPDMSEGRKMGKAATLRGGQTALRGGLLASERCVVGGGEMA